MPNIEETVTALEKINEVIDLCIDRELFNYGYLANRRILFFSKEAEAHLNELHMGKKKISYESFLFDYPITAVCLPQNIVGPRLSEYTRKISLKRKCDELKPWSNIFWAKRLRAEILKRNSDEWNKNYDDIIFFMEKNIPLNKPSQSLADKRTLFNYIMELAALSLGEGSLGYVDRARNIFKEDLDPYISWLGWNSGTAWQHIGYSQRAVREYNWVISNLYKKVELNNLFEYDKKFLEFLLNVWPAIIQRAAIQLKLQLSYHAIRTLDDESIKIIKKDIEKEKSDLFIRSFKHLEIQTELLKIESLLQQEDLDTAKEKISSITNDIFPGSKWHESYLPEFNSSSPFRVFQIQLTEHIIAMHLEQLRQVSKDPSESIDIKFVCNLFNYIGTKYWDQVRDNNYDKLVYITRWAQYLMVGITICTNGKLNADDENKFLTAIKSMYVRHRNLLPIRNEKSKKIGNGNRRLKLDKFKPDDFADFVGGLSEFYKKISKKFKKEKLERSGNEKFTRKRLAVDHCQILEAMDEYENNFGEKRRITALDRYNEALIWEKKDSNCINCLNKADKKTSFVNLLKCANISRSPKLLKGHDYENIMKQAEEHLVTHLSSRTIHKNTNGKNKAELHFLGLQRWNSLTPAQGYSVGGGYFIYHTDNGRIDLGIAIDPGFDFVRNLFKMGFSLKDIDVILVSHAHADHIWDFESLVQLANELSKKKEKEKEKGEKDHRFNVILSLGSYRRVEHIIKNPVLRRFVNPLIIDITKEIDDNLLDVSFERCFDGSWRPIWGGNIGDIRIKCTTAYHNDNSDRSDSFGFILEFGNERSGIKFGYTGDTKWVSDDLYRPLLKGNFLKAVSKQYVDCDVLLLHLGSLINHRENTFSRYNPDKCVEMIRKENHLYLMGTIRFLKRLNRDYVSDSSKRLILLGEFGEELRGGIRKDIVQRLQGISANKWQIIPVDVGLDVLLNTSNNDDSRIGKHNSKIKDKYQFLCTLCDRYHPIGDIEYMRYGEDEAIFHVCQTCAKALPDDVQQSKFRKIYEIGKEIRI